MENEKRENCWQPKKDQVYENVGVEFFLEGVYKKN